MFANIEEAYRLDKSSILCFYRQLVRPEFDTHSNQMNPDGSFGRDFREAEAQLGQAGLHEDIGRL